ncbi:MAG: hypothetical protein GY742_07570 [Hyphomicrobiales bacterium]|nr:hypothetical protein [Hyphomicrobiales bacterium]
MKELDPMVWLGRFRFALWWLIFLLPGGCASTIKEYDSTFTSMITETGATQLRTLSVNGEQTPLRVTPISNRDRPYFIEFRARNALSYGHASVVFGKLDQKGNIPVDENGVLLPKMVEISGLHPATPSNLPWSVGHVVPVPAETGPSDGDFEDAYVTARFRIDLAEQEFRKVVAIVHKHKKLSTMWYAPIFDLNCLGYISSIARDMNLRVPRRIEFPREYITSLKALNLPYSGELDCC